MNKFKSGILLSFLCVGSQVGFPSQSEQHMDQLSSENESGQTSPNLEQLSGRQTEDATQDYNALALKRLNSLHKNFKKILNIKRHTFIEAFNKLNT